VTHLRKMMLEELQRRHYSEATTQRYIRFIERFAQHFHCSPDRLGPRHIREYQAQLFTVRKLTPGSVTNHLCALRFLYIQTLKRPWSIADTPYPKKRYRLPTILSQEEVAQLIDAAPTPFYRTILMTLYGTGVRRTELTRLKVSDIDSRRMVVHIQDGKGGQDRDVMLSPVLLEELRAHWALAKKVRLVISRQPLAQPGITPPMTRRPTTPASRPPAAPGLRNVSIPTCSAIASPPTCSKPAPTCTPSRFC
jgi:integrase/recombinase XerD